MVYLSYVYKNYQLICIYLLRLIHRGQNNGEDLLKQKVKGSAWYIFADISDK